MTRSIPDRMDATGSSPVKKICLYGPESTGKTGLAITLAQCYQTEWVPEMYKQLFPDNHFTLEDIMVTARAQNQAVLEKEKTANRILFCDTDVITTSIYSRIYLNAVPPGLADLEKQIQYDLYCLMDIDIPWVPDGYRDLGHRREEVYALFQQALDQRRLPYLKVSGPWHQRLAIIKAAVEELLQR